MKRVLKLFIRLLLLSACVSIVQVLILSLVGFNITTILSKKVDDYRSAQEEKNAIAREREYDLQYQNYIDSLNIFDNTVKNAIPQTTVFDLVMDHFGSALENGKTCKKALIIGYDGCRLDSLPSMILEEKSGLNRLRTSGRLLISFAGGDNNVEQTTATGPGWVSMLCGEWADSHAVYSNECTKNDKETFLTSLSKKGVHCSFIARWRPLFTRILSPDIELSIKTGLPTEYRYVIDDKEIYYSSLKNIVDMNHNSSEDVLFVIFEDIDSTGHSRGFGSEEYLAVCKIIDEYTYNIIETVYSRETYDSEDWLIIITTDHGGYYKGHGGQSDLERITWIACNKKLF